MSSKIQDGVGNSNLLEINSANQAEVKLANPVELNATEHFDKVGTVRITGEVDAGTKTGTATLKSIYVDQYYRTYISEAQSLDTETFNYTAQNTGKHTLTATTMTTGFTAAGVQTNSSNITTTTTGSTFGTYAMFPLIGNTNLDAEMVVSFSAQPTTNTIIDFGLFQRGAATAYAPTDGAYFRLTSAGLFGVINSNGTETVSSLFSFTYANNQKYRFYISVTIKSVQFWINDILFVDIAVPAALGQPFLSAAVPLSLRHAIVGGAAGSVINMNLNQYSIISAGTEASDSLGTISNRCLGSYQGLSGGTMGSLASYANNTNPTANVPTNTTSTVLTALGGQGWETDTLAVTTDGIIMSYQVPAGTALIQGKRLRLTGFKMDSYVQSVIVGGGYNAQFSLCFGHTSVSLATAESANTKAPRRIALGSYSVAATAAALSQLSTISIDLTNAPIYVNPGEFIAVAKKKVGTAPSAGVIAYTFTPIYTWE